MHDIDRALFEVGQETFGENETYQAYEFQTENEALETELAYELLEVNSDGELDQFLGNLIGRAASAVRGFASSPTGQALGGVLKDAARQVLPRAGQIIGDAVMPGRGGQFGRSAGQWLGRQFEAEGLSGEDRDLEIARTIVRVGTEATRNAIAAGPAAPAKPTAVKSLVTAANRNLPALVPVIRTVAQGAPARPGGVPTASGRWIRRGRRIILLDL